jgi:uncharacterized protein (TIGR03435 family)
MDTLWVRVGRQSTLSALIFRILVGAVILGALSGPLKVQAVTSQSISSGMRNWQIAGGGKLSFEVATIKPNFSDDSPKVNFTLGPGDTYAATAGRFLASNISLLDYIRFAYKLTDGQIEILQANAPKWIATTRFDVEAKSEIQDPTKDQMRLMMQSLLAERFKLVVHTETRQLSILALVQTKPGRLGPQLRPHPAEDAKCSNVVTSTDPSESETSAAIPTVCGGLVNVGVPGAPAHVRIGGRRVPLTLLAAHLSEMGQFDRPVLDRTGLSETFDFVLEWGTDPPSGSTSTQSNDDRQTNLQEALQDQLGLKLERQKAPMDVLLIDHVDQQPIEN